MFEVFKNYPNLLVAFSEKKDGDMKLGDSPEETQHENRKQFFAKLGLEPRDVVAAGLVQADIVQVVQEKDRGTVLPETDASLTQTKGVFLSITAADCLPVFFYDPAKEAVVIAHAGWRGLAKGILPQVVQRMRSEFSSNPRDILVAIGPGIGECHYDVKEDVAEQFREYSAVVINREGKIFLDLKKIATMQLEREGVLPANMEVSPVCTYDVQDQYFSWRRDKKEFAKVRAMLALIGMRK